MPSAKEPKVWIGTSGWVYKHWRDDVFYPSALPADEELQFYAGHFSTVEINFTFYRLPERAVFEDWRRRTPKGFRFAVKGSRYLTHMKKLSDPEEPLERLMDRASGLGEKLGPVLFQLPPSWPLHIERLAPFLDLLKDHRRRRFAFEFRHESWQTKEVFRLLDRAGAALCIPVAPGVPAKPVLIGNWSYIRFHRGRYGTGFGDRELRLWAGRIHRFVKDGADVFAYFNNDTDGCAIRDAQRLRKITE